MKNIILQGDCLNLMNDIPDGSIDMILCDLPYGTTACKWDTVIPFDKLWANYERIIKSNGAIVLTAQTPFDKVLGSSNLKLLKYEWIWQKTHPTGHLNSKKMPMKSHENILVFYKKLPVYNAIKTEGHIQKKAKKSKDKSQIYGKQNAEGITYDSTERYPLSVIVFSSDKQKQSLHPTQKPVALFEYLIKTYTNEGDVVLDNCAGSGTTAIACQNTNRNYILMEQEEKYIDVINDRVLKNSFAKNLDF